MLSRKNRPNPCDRFSAHWPHLLRSTAANAVAEYAVLLAVLIGGLLVGVRLLGTGVHNTFGQLADGEMAAPTPKEKQVEAQASTATAQTDEMSLLEQFRLLFAELVAIAALGGTWYYMRTARKRKEMLEEEREAPEVITWGVQPNRLFKKRQQIYDVLSSDMYAVLSNRMLVEHLMSRNLSTVLASAPVEEVAGKMREDKFRHLLVCNQEGQLVGIVSDRDLLRGHSVTAADMMTPNPTTVTPQTLISPAVTLMLEQRISCLPVVDEEGSLCGMLTTTDLMMALQCALQILHKLAADIGHPGSVEEELGPAYGVAE